MNALIARLKPSRDVPHDVPSSVPRVVAALGFVAFVVAAAPPAFAQSPNTSTIVVLVSDPSGAAVADANVTVTNDQTGATRQVVSGRDGSASVPALPLTGS